MSRNYLAFDIETAKDIPGTDFNWKPHRPLGITCIASMLSGGTEPRVWHSRNPDGTPAGRMTHEDVAEFVEYVDKHVHEGATPLTWNGLAFDYDILAEESGQRDACKRQALMHVDMMFHIVCVKGFPVGLAKAASGMGLAGKLDGVTGSDAPRLWAQGEHDTVMKYVAQDVRATFSLACECEKQKTFRWRTRRGSLGQMALPHGWLSVTEASKLPLPDTSWMSTPLQRSDYTAWMTES